MQDNFVGTFSPKSGVYRYQYKDKYYYSGASNYKKALLSFQKTIPEFNETKIERLNEFRWDLVTNVGVYGAQERQALEELLLNHRIRKSQCSLKAFSAITGLNPFFIQNYLLNPKTNGFMHMNPDTFSFVKMQLTEAAQYKSRNNKWIAPVFLPAFLKENPEYDLCVSEINLKQLGVYQIKAKKNQLIHYSARTPFDVLAIANICSSAPESLKRVVNGKWESVAEYGFYESKFIDAFQNLFKITKDYYINQTGKTHGATRLFSNIINVAVNRLQFASKSNYLQLNNNYSIVPNFHVIEWSINRMINKKILTLDCAQGIFEGLKK